MKSGYPTRGARIQSVRQGRQDELVLETYEPRLGLRRWEISADREDARWVETFSSTSGKTVHSPFRTSESPFALLAKARLEGGRIAAFEFPEEHSVLLTVETADGEFGLQLELNRKWPELVLLDPHRIVIGALRSRPDGGSHIAAVERPAVGQRYVRQEQVTPFFEPPSRKPPESPEAARAVSRAWEQRLVAHDLERARIEALRLIRQSKHKLERRLVRLAEDQAAAAKAEQFQRWGELLKIHGARVHREQRNALGVTVPDEFAEGRPLVTIPLDPSLSMADNIAMQFRQYRKRTNALSHIAQRRADTERELASVLSAEAAVTGAGGAEAVWAAVQPVTRTRSRDEGLERPAGAGQRNAGYLRKWDAVRTVERRSSDGLTILVGRSAADNDALTFRIAKGRDWLFHAAGFPGSHVVVRHPAGGPLPPATLKEAAWLAAHYSKARRQSEVEVAYVERKHVRKVPKAPAGTVTFSHGKTLWVDMRDTRLKQVLNLLPAEDDLEQKG
jgi:hypothetical protein